MLREFVERVTSGGHLSDSEAEETLKIILSEAVDDKDIASLLIALSEKGESADEITGFARGMRSFSIKVKSERRDLVDVVGTGGGIQTFNVSTTSAFVIAGAGAAVAKHGNRAVTSSSGSADVLSALGVNVDHPPEVTKRCLEEIGVAFLYAPSFHPAMKRVAGIRRRLGRRTIFNLLGPVTNPADAPFQLIGVYAPELTHKLASALASLGCERAWVVHSRDGMDEISPSARTQISQVRDGQVTSLDFDPTKYGVRLTGAALPCGGTPFENAQISSAILENRLRGPARDTVLLNSAAALHLVDGRNFEQALARAEDSLASGAANEKLRRLVEATN